MNNKLTKIELKLLYNLVEASSMVLDSEYEDDTRELDILENSIIKKLEKNNCKKVENCFYFLYYILNNHYEE